MTFNYFSLYDSEYQAVVFWVMTPRTFKDGYVTKEPSSEMLAPPTKLCIVKAHNFMFYNVGNGRHYGFITFCYVTRSKRLTSGR